MPQPADAIVVLGCRLATAGRPSERLRRRVACGIALYQDGAAPLVVMSGGGDGPIAEAEAMRALALQSGVAETALLCEPASRDTVENAVNTARLLRERGLSRVILVTDQAHLLRAALLFRLAGLDVVDRAGISAQMLGGTVALLYELGALPRSLIRLWKRRR